MKIRHGVCAGALVASAGLAAAQPTIDGIYDPGTEGGFYSDVLWAQNVPTGFGNNDAGDFYAGGSGDVGDPENVTTGAEICIPKSDFSGATSFRVAGWINSGDRTFMSNQILHDGGLDTDTGNIGGMPDFDTDPRFDTSEFVAVNTFGSGTPTVDGTLDAGVYTVQHFVQTNYTGFGDNGDATQVGGGGSEIDGLYVAQDASNYYFFVAGNTEANGNGLDLFIDLDNGSTGSASISSGSGGVGGARLDGMNGIVFDAGFAANLYVTVDNDGTDVNLHKGVMGNSGTSSSVDLVEMGPNYGSGTNVAIDNSNIAGVVGNPVNEPDTPAAPDANYGYGSEANNVRAYIDPAARGIGATNKLYIFIGGNMEVNSNKLSLFIDAQPGGQGTLRTDNIDISFNGLNRMGGLVFDAGFEADYWMSINTNIDPAPFLVNFTDAAVLRTNGPLLDPFSMLPLDYGSYCGGQLENAGVPVMDPFEVIDFAGDPDTRFDVQDGFTASLFSNWAPRSSQLFSPAMPAGGLLQIAIDNSNVAGVSDTSGDECDAKDVNTGIEIAIDLDELGWDGSQDIRIAGFIINSGFDFASNQFLGGFADGDPGNLGDPAAIDLTTHNGDQFVNLMGTPPTFTCGCSSADLAAPFGTLDFFDVLEYLGLFDAMDPTADLAAPFGTWDFFDVLEFLGIFDLGCP